MARGGGLAQGWRWLLVVARWEMATAYEMAWRGPVAN
jgi:hypothetical protein